MVTAAVLVVGALLTVLTGSANADDQIAADAGSAAEGAAPSDEVTLALDQYDSEILPLLTKYCGDCHDPLVESGGVAFEALDEPNDLLQRRKMWQAAMQSQRNKTMPPENEAQPSDGERQKLLDWFEQSAEMVDCSELRPGPSVVRRLNRTEYANTIRDLFGIDYNVADAVGLTPETTIHDEYFDNLANTLGLPDILLEKYLAAADKVLDRVVIPQYPEQRVEAESLEISLLPKQDGKLEEGKTPLHEVKNGFVVLNAPLRLHGTLDLKEGGRYLIRLRGWGQPGKRWFDTPEAALKINGEVVRTAKFREEPENARTLRIEAFLEPGKNELEFFYVNSNYIDRSDDPGKISRVAIDSLTFVGPMDESSAGLHNQKAYEQLFFISPQDGHGKREAARKIIERFARRAYRRPVDPQEVKQLMSLYDMAAAEGMRFDEGVRAMLKAVLVSPHFLLRIEEDQKPAGSPEPYRITDHELAVRLSYFLWSTTPDEELMELAEKDDLHRPQVLREQVLRMIADPRADELVKNFGGQWLRFRYLAEARPSQDYFPDLTDRLRQKMHQEIVMLFEHIMREDRSILDFLDADYTFTDRNLAQHYNLKGKWPGDWKTRFTMFKVKLDKQDKEAGRGGVLGTGAFAMMTAHTHRTSPTLRGKYILSVILGTPPPPPPPDAAADFEEGNPETAGLSFREKLKLHATSGSCANCHQKMDPLGFALDNLRPDGKVASGDDKVDASGKLPDGTTLSGPADLKNVLMERQDMFLRNLAEKMLTYALGRELEYYDECAVRQTVANLKQNDHRFSELIIGVVESYPFQHRINSSAERDSSL